MLNLHQITIQRIQIIIKIKYKKYKILKMKNILILTANPINTKPLRLNEEVRKIKDSWERSPSTVNSHQSSVIFF